MKNLLPISLRSLLFAGILLLMSVSSYATHIVGAELRYKWVSGLTYQITVYLYGDCGPSSSAAFALLPSSRPSVCVFDGATPLSTLTLNLPIPSTGTEVTPVCPDSLAFTQCTNMSYMIPGIKKFVYSVNVTLPHTSANWRFIYNGSNGGSSAGRAAVITNINTGGGTTLIQLIDTLNNSPTNTRGNNSSPVLTVEPVPYFCNGMIGGPQDCYNPGAIDLYDVGPGEPSGDSLVFSLIAPTNGTGGCGGVGGAATYIATQCPSGPTNTGQFPLYDVDCTPASFSFDPSTGQLCFNPLIQRSVVVYNVEEYRADTVSTLPLVVNHVLVGTLQREMTFRVQTCSYTTPFAKIDSFSGPGDTLSGYHYYSCANSGSFSFYANPTETDTALHISVTATGLSAGFTFSVVGDGTSSPHVTLTGNTSLIIPGDYVIYLTFTDNHCPLVGTKTYAFTIDILPVPTISDSTVVHATCQFPAVMRFIPGGTGKPWTIKLSHNPPTLPLSSDTFQVFTFDTTSFTDSLAPGPYFETIFTAVSNECKVGVPFVVDTPHFTIIDTFINPIYCGAANGELMVAGLDAGFLDTLRFDFDGVPQPPEGFFSNLAGTDTAFGLLAGLYTNIIVQEGFCYTKPATPRTLVNPPFVWRTVTTGPTTKCGYCNGLDTLFGLHPGQLDTITYNFTHFSGGPTTSGTVSHFVTADSTAQISGLCAGLYSNFVVHTGGGCSYTVPGPFAVDSQSIIADFDSVIHYGCHGDTLMFNNLSSYTSILDSGLAYLWTFGDGTSSVLRNPEHIYINTSGNSYTVKLQITNGVCIDTSESIVTLSNYVHSGFTFAPDPFVCQDSAVNFTSTATGTNLSYFWEFGDGNTDVTPDPSHVYANTGKYTIKLIAGDHVIPTPQYFSPCYDTVSETISVDSISALSILATDSVLCMGQAINFTGIYSTLGDTLVAWTFGDGNATVGANPIIHSYDGAGQFTIILDVKYRACPEKTASRSVTVFGVPSIYLGPDLAICPGGVPLSVTDDRNSADPKASWKWNTGETTPGITIVKPGDYYAVVTIDGCSSSDTVTVKRDCYMDIPNVFTPNGDGTNDYFFPRQMLTRGVITFKMDIYNRWGQNVYETTNTDGRGWDGAFNNIQQPEGVYVYLIDATFKDGQIEHHQGNVTLLR